MICPDHLRNPVSWIYPVLTKGIERKNAEFYNPTPIFRAIRRGIASSLSPRVAVLLLLFVQGTFAFCQSTPEQTKGGNIFISVNPSMFNPVRLSNETNPGILRFGRPVSAEFELGVAMKVYQKWQFSLSLSHVQIPVRYKFKFVVPDEHPINQEKKAVGQYGFTAAQYDFGGTSVNLALSFIQPLDNGDRLGLRAGVSSNFYVRTRSKVSSSVFVITSDTTFRDYDLIDAVLETNDNSGNLRFNRLSYSIGAEYFKDLKWLGPMSFGLKYVFQTRPLLEGRYIIYTVPSDETGSMSLTPNFIGLTISKHFYGKKSR